MVLVMERRLVREQSDKGVLYHILGIGSRAQLIERKPKDRVAMAGEGVLYEIV